MGETVTYVYCVVCAPKKVKLGRFPNGLSGAERPRLFEASGGYQLVAASAPLELYDSAVIDAKLRDLDWVGARAAEHEAVVEHCAELATVVPMKLFTMFKSDARAVAHVQKMKRSLDRVVEKIAGCEEWGLRIFFDEARAARAAAEAARAQRVSSGTGFLLRKKALDEKRRQSGARGAGRVDALYAAVADLTKLARRRSAPNRELAGQVVLDAVFLVPKRAVGRLKKTVGASAESLVEEGFDVTLSGPWPAYSFIGSR